MSESGSTNFVEDLVRLQVEATGDDRFLDLGSVAEARLDDGATIPLRSRTPCTRQTLLKRRPRSGAHGLRRWRDLALGLLAGSLALDADQQLLIEDREDAVEHRDRRYVLTAFELGDVGVRGAGLPGDLLLGQVQFVAALADVGGDPVLLTQRPDRSVLVSGRAVRRAAPSAAPGRLGCGPALRADFAGCAGHGH